MEDMSTLRSAIEETRGWIDRERRYVTLTDILHRLDSILAADRASETRTDSEDDAWNRAALLNARAALSRGDASLAFDIVAGALAHSEDVEGGTRSEPVRGSRKPYVTGAPSALPEELEHGHRIGCCAVYEPLLRLLLVEREQKEGVGGIDWLQHRLDETEAYAKEGWAWVDDALEALGAKDVFEIKQRGELLRLFLAEHEAYNSGDSSVIQSAWQAVERKLGEGT